VGGLKPFGQTHQMEAPETGRPNQEVAKSHAGDRSRRAWILSLVCREVWESRPT
jgi:hypothetical protein